MIKKVIVTNSVNETLEINLFDDNPDHGLLITSMEGLGPPKASINMTGNATTDGSIYNSARVTQRNITISMIFVPADTIEETRRRTYKYFPLKNNITLAIETDTRTVQTECFVESNDPDIFSEQEGCQISLVCPDPYFYGTKMAVTTFSDVEPLFHFPFSNESLEEPKIIFGKVRPQLERVIDYDGDIEVGMIIHAHINGPDVGDLIFYNIEAYEILTLLNDQIRLITGSGLSEGDEVIISTMPRKRKAILLRQGFEINILNAVEKNSDWIKIRQGKNTFIFTANKHSELIEFEIQNNVCYEGV